MDNTMDHLKDTTSTETHIKISTDHPKDIMRSLACNMGNQCHRKAITWTIEEDQERVKDVVLLSWVPWLAAAV